MDELFDHSSEAGDDAEPEVEPPVDEHDEEEPVRFAPPGPAGDPEEEPSGIAERLRAASFGVARRGYDRRQVDEFLARLAKRLESESSGFDADSVKRQLQQVGESTTGILTAAEETARKLRTEAAREADELRRRATEAAERLRSEAAEYAQTTRERATEEARRLHMEAANKAEQAVSTAEHRADELLERSLEQRRVLEARIGRMVEQRAAITERVRRLSDELARLAEPGEDAELDLDDEPEEEPEEQITGDRDFGFGDTDETAAYEPDR